MSNVKLSVVTPVYNGEKTIEKTMKSVLSQGYDNLEYIIIDGGSTDKTTAIVNSYIEKYGSIIKLVSEKDNGIYDAMNKGIGLATGEIVGIINSDDYYEPEAFDKIATAYAALGRDTEYAILYGAVRIIENDKENAIILYSHNNLPKQMIMHQGCFVTRKLYEDKGTFSTEYRYSSDYEFMLRMYEDKDVVFKPVYELLANFVLGGASGRGAAYLETHKLWYSKGYITKKKYNLVKTKVRVSKLLKRKRK